MERLEVRQVLDEIQSNRPDLPEGLMERLWRALEQESPSRVEEIKGLFKEFSRG